MTDPLTVINLRSTSQSVQSDPRQVRNNAGGWVFQVDDMARLRRFLVLGVLGGTFYVGERELTAENADLVLTLARERGADVVAEVVAISTAGRAPKHEPGLFALAAVSALGDAEGKAAAHAALPVVARTGTHLFTFVRYAEQMRGWGRALRRAVGAWYTDKSYDDLAYQLVKYRSRADWTHRDVLRLAHPKAEDPMGAALFDFVCGRDPGEYAPRIVEGFLRAQAAESPQSTADLVREYRLPWEALWPEHLSSPVVWEALLDAGMPMTALLRNLPRLTRLGLLPQGGERTRAVVAQLTDPGRLRKARVHPVAVLIALRTYASGRSLRGESTWVPTPQVVDGLDAAFYAAFGAVEPAGKRILLALDVSGSMRTSIVAGIPMSAREAAAAMAMVTVATEPHVDVVGFTATLEGGPYGRWHGLRTVATAAEALTPLDLSPRRRLDDIVRYMDALPFGGTDCALPWTYALEQGRAYDAVITLTDAESWAGPVHVHQAQRLYRDRTGLATRSVVAAFTATSYTVSDPSDPLSLDIVGLDSAVPSLIADFSAGRV